MQLPNVLTLDETRKRAKRSRVPIKTTASRYESQLRKVSTVVNQIVTASYGRIKDAALLRSLLEQYARTLAPWAERTARRMLLDVDDSTRQSWRALGQEISLGLKAHLESAPIGNVFRTLLQQQVGLITSIPQNAAERVHKLATEALATSNRFDVLAEEILRTGDVSKSRAILIARTETSRAATTFVEARAEYAGSTHFIWRTSRDGTVRPSHKALEGQTFRWDDPPECDPGYHALPGCIWNCRCWAEAILPDPYKQ